MVVAVMTNHQSEQNVFVTPLQNGNILWWTVFFDKFHGMVNRIALTHVLTLTPNAQINRHQIIRMVLISSVCMPFSRLPFLASQPIWIRTHQNSNKWNAVGHFFGWNTFNPFSFTFIWIGNILLCGMWMPREREK